MLLPRSRRAFLDTITTRVAQTFHPPVPPAHCQAMAPTPAPSCRSRCQTRPPQLHLIAPAQLPTRWVPS
jgi:hypothetical protein